MRVYIVNSEAPVKNLFFVFLHNVMEMCDTEMFRTFSVYNRKIMLYESDGFVIWENYGTIGCNNIVIRKEAEYECICGI